MKMYTKRCNFADCKKKLKLTDMECKCGMKYCQLHRLPEVHTCNYDHGAFDKLLLTTRLINEKTVCEKIIKL